jgi:hypothetical protein
MLSAQALGTQIELFRFPIKQNSGSLNIRQPAATGMLLRMAYPMSEVCRFTADIAFIGQIANSFYLSRS